MFTNPAESRTREFRDYLTSRSTARAVNRQKCHFAGPFPINFGIDPCCCLPRPMFCWVCQVLSHETPTIAVDSPWLSFRGGYDASVARIVEVPW
jgi:hypothetical protein